MKIYINIIIQKKILLINFILKLSKVIDISVWDNDNIKKYTVDNMQLTYEGSEWIYHKLINYIKIFMFININKSIKFIFINFKFKIM